MIERTKQEVEQQYCIANGYDTDAQVIYGDTDSVMINFKVKTLERSMELGREAAEYISTKFVKPIKLEFEKVKNIAIIFLGQFRNIYILSIFFLNLQQKNTIYPFPSKIKNVYVYT